MLGKVGLSTPSRYYHESRGGYDGVLSPIRSSREGGEHVSLTKSPLEYRVSSNAEEILNDRLVTFLLLERTGDPTIRFFWY